MAEQTFDYVIVGGGSTGATLAAALVKNGRSTVALIEAGPGDDHPDIDDLFRYRHVLRSPLTRWLRTVATDDNNPAVTYPQSSVLGGCAKLLVASVDCPPGFASKSRTSEEPLPVTLPVMPSASPAESNRANTWFSSQPWSE